MHLPSESVRVLHVDDDPDFANMAATFIEREDDRFDVETATGASEGIDRLARRDFDCVVSDYEMPGQNGIEFLEAVRAGDSDLPFILFTGKGSEEVASDAISAGVTDYLQKERVTEQYQLLAKRIVDAVEHRHAKTSYREIFEKIPDGIVIHDPTDGSFTDMNAQYAELFGYEREELLDAGFAAIHRSEGPYTLETARRRVREVADTGPHTFEWPGVRKDGEQFWAEVHLTPTQLHGNERILAVVRDISDRKERERRFEAVFNNAYTFIGLLDPDGTVIEANDTALSFGGLDRTEVLGKPLWETAWVESNDDVRATVRDAVAHARNGEFVRDEIRVHGSDRDAVVDFSVRPIVDERGEVTLLISEGRDITARKEQDHKRQQIIDRVTDAIIEVDADWTFTLVNEQAEALSAMDEEELLGRDFWEVFPDALGTRFEGVYREVMDARDPASFVEYFSQLDGWFDIQVYPEDCGGLAFYFRDVTERIERSHELEQMRALLDHTEQIADVGGWAIDTETQDVFWTDHLFEMLGVDYETEPPLEDALDVYVEEDRPLVENAVAEALATGESFDVDARFERPDGEVRWFQIRGEPTLEDGEVVTLRGAVQDITERKEREQTLEQTEARFRALAENFPNGAVHYFDEDLRYQYVAGAGFDPIDTSPEDLAGNTIYEVEPYSAEIVDTLESLMNATLAGNEEAVEITYEGRIFDLRSVPIRGPDGAIMGGFFITQNITAQRRRERALEHQNDQLEQFASIVSHDLRNPLNVAQGRLGLAMEECDSEHHDSIEDALARCHTLIDDILTLAREGDDATDLEPVALGPLAESCWHTVETTGATITIATDRTIHADRSRLQQFLENLYRNAVEHGGDDVAVTVGDLANGFYVVDDGQGIPESHREQVFEPGYSTDTDGTGYGLQIVREIATAHGWEVHVTTSDEGGARFDITGVAFADG